LKWQNQNPERSLARKRKWAKDNAELVTTRRRERHLEIKTSVMNAYGGRCACCGERHLVFLSIDHVNGDGAEHRRSGAKSGRGFYNWLRENNFPDGYQVLCFNCNFAKSQYGGCPHQETNVRPSLYKSWALDSRL